MNDMVFKRISALLIVCIVLIFILPVSAATTNTTSVWEQMAIHDLTETKKIIKNNYPKAQIDNSFYALWLDSGYKKAINMTSDVHSFSGYISVMRFYLNGFKDFHTMIVPLLDITNPSNKWPGFIVGKRDDKIVVVERDAKSGLWDKLPAMNSTLISCDGLSVVQLMKKNIMPFYPLQEKYSSTWDEYYPQLFVWSQNPYILKPKTCVFKSGNDIRSYDLNWQVISNPTPISEGQINFGQKLVNAGFGPIPQFGISNFANNNGVWISIPIFAGGLSIDHTTTDKWLTNIANKVQKLRNIKILVFDLRGNTGGDPRFSEPIIMNLYGQSYLKKLGSNFIWNTPKVIKFVANDESLQHMIQSNSPEKMINGMKQSIAEGKKVFIYQSNYFNDQADYKLNSITVKVIILTDGRCASECNNFVQTLKSIPGVKHMGRPTSPVADSTWNNVYVFQDKAAAIVYPTGLIISPKLSDGVPLFPDAYYSGYMGDTKALKKWVWQLYIHKTI